MVFILVTREHFVGKVWYVARINQFVPGKCLEGFPVIGRRVSTRRFFYNAIASTVVKRNAILVDVLGSQHQHLEAASMGTNRRVVVSTAFSPKFLR